MQARSHGLETIQTVVIRHGRFDQQILFRIELAVAVVEVQLDAEVGQRLIVGS